MPRLIVALDLPTLPQIHALAQALLPLKPIMKVGYEAYYAHGASLVSWLSEHDLPVMLDLKLHDIPRTVEAAIKALLQPGIAIMTLHALGGEAMLQAAVQTAEQLAREQNFAAPQLFGVTILTSHSEIELPELGFEGGMGENVVRLAALARNAGCAGVVCSPHEATDLKAFFGSDFAALCPGVRPAGSSPGDDQRRATTPAAAVAAGADYLVVGRPITQAADPLRAAQAILDEMHSAEVER